MPGKPIVCVLACAFSASAVLCDTTEVSKLPIEPRSGTPYDEIRYAQIFEATGFRDKPNLSAYGIRPVLLAYHVDDLPDRLSQVATEASAGRLLLCLDMEKHPIDPMHVDEDTVQNSLSRLSRVADYIHMVQPDVRLGFYRMMPLTLRHKNSWRTQPEQWKQADQRSRHRITRLHSRDEEGLSDKVDVLFPSLYAPGPDVDEWYNFAKATIALAREHQKQVYPFIWFKHHGSPQYEGQDVDPEMFRVMMLTCLRQADGVVIWGGVDEPWDADASWVNIMFEVARDLRRTREMLHNTQP